MGLAWTRKGTNRNSADGSYGIWVCRTFVAFGGHGVSPHLFAGRAWAAHRKETL